ncbi:MAG: ABC transporter ATP-binding protein [Syntrophales bacterium]|nr:ABC transporter ATP-binding protein [Syntrophales bacterium]
MVKIAMCVKVESVSCIFHPSIVAVDNVSFEIKEGTITGLFGSDGSGKSTMLKMLATVIPPTSGRITIFGLDPIQNRKKVKNLIGYMPQRFGLYLDLTVQENLQFFMDIYGIPKHKREELKEKYLKFSNLLPFTDRLTRELSGGMKQKLALACVLVNEPKLLILDEPTSGVDPVSRREFWRILDRMRDRGITIIISTTYIDEVNYCDFLALMHRGKILTFDTPSSFQNNFPDLESAMIARIEAHDR